PSHPSLVHGKQLDHFPRGRGSGSGCLLRLGIDVRVGLAGTHGTHPFAALRRWAGSRPGSVQGGVVGVAVTGRDGGAYGRRTGPAGAADAADRWKSPDRSTRQLDRRALVSREKGRRWLAMPVRRVYLDHAATTPVKPEVRQRMAQVLADGWGNPSSLHHAGRAARAVVDTARSQVARLLGCEPREVIFTGSGTEANNLAVKGAAWAHRDRGRHIVTTVIEHPSVLYACRALERDGFEISYVPVDRDGCV